MDNNMITEWALIRRNELVGIPDRLDIHPDFLQHLSHDEFESAFRRIHEMFYLIYTDIAQNPKAFGFPLYRQGEVDYFSKEAREVRMLSWTPFYLLLYLFAYSEPKNGSYVTDTAKVRSEKKVKKSSLLLKALSGYGFVFRGIQNFSLSSAPRIEIDYPDNRNILSVLYLVAKKVMNTQLGDEKNHFSNMVVFSNAFIGWNYKILSEPMDCCTVAEGCDYVADKMHNEEDKAVIALLDSILKQKGFTSGKGDANEGPSIRYYRTKSAYDFALFSDKGELVLELRIRNAGRCLDYLNECPESIIAMFRKTDQGCQSRADGTCKYGVKYEFENEEKWHCGCYGAPFKIHPVKEDVEHYLRLVELGNKK